MINHSQIEVPTMKKYMFVFPDPVPCYSFPCDQSYRTQIAVTLSFDLFVSDAP